MNEIGKENVSSYRAGSTKLVQMSSNEIREARPVHVQDYQDLVTRIASLHFNNKQFTFLYRWQRKDHKLEETGQSSLKPGIFRPDESMGAIPDPKKLKERFDKLNKAERKLLEFYKTASLAGYRELERQRILRWAILQHYEVCLTPLLDATASLRTACSFACCRSNGSQLPDTAHIMVMALPFVGGGVSVSGDAGIQVIRLSGILPSEAIRPHIQEAYLIGEYPDMLELDQKLSYQHVEVDFGRRLLAKFKFKPREFWDQGFPPISDSMLYPPEGRDCMILIANRIKEELENQT